ncbi:FAD-dependent oxidoreductase [Virgisporangium ochraceum]|uniref:Monooxygenase n=1 Tax=Virgisporangium ochraceum TaxID=65505 RepID=A0A8J3ZUG6_9ACTN|nr:FAD-dependent oxidoreductase [Virgisporangium ochraceum]GIJ70669.1 monooxygenase [Virgisporangium ochraceum]
MSQHLEADCCIVGCGPAGVMLGLLLARRGADVVVLEKHTDFLRDFRGDDIAAATIEILDELGLAEGFLALSPRRVRAVRAHTAGGTMLLADLSRVRTKFPFVAVVPQWDFLSFLAAEAATEPGFRLLMGAAATDLVTNDDGVVEGVRFRRGDEEGVVRATLTVAADGRTSVLRDRAELPVHATAPPIDMMLFRLPRQPTDADEDAINIHLGGSWAMARLDRGDYWQAACMIPKGAADTVRAAGVDALRRAISEVMPDLADHVGALETWDQIHLLSVQTNRLRRWYRPGLLCIGDCAHAMSPIGGTGVNFAIQDAVVAANRLAEPILRRAVTTRDLAGVQRERQWQVRAMQLLQSRLTKGYVSAAEGANRGPGAIGQRIAPVLLNLPGFCALRSRVTALGLRRVHVAPEFRTAVRRPRQR